MNLVTRQVIQVDSKACYFAHLVKSISTVKGCVVELGVGAAKSAKYICKAIMDGDIIRDYWGFDSFLGFPSPSDEDYPTTKSDVREGYFMPHWCDSPEEAVSRITSYAKYPHGKVHVVQGYFSIELFRQFNATPIALLHLDCDLYNSYILGLNYFYRYVAHDGIIAFDEYCDPLNMQQWPGAQRAVDRWLKTTPYQKSDLREATWKSRGGRIVHKFYLSKAVNNLDITMLSYNMLTDSGKVTHDPKW